MVTDQNKNQVNELQNLNAIMFDRNGDVIKGNFSINDIAKFMERRRDYKTLAAYDNSKTLEYENDYSFNELVANSLYYKNSEETRSDKKNKELPSLILFVPKQINRAD